MPKTFSGLSSSALQNIYTSTGRNLNVYVNKKFLQKKVNQRFYHFLYSNDKFYKFYNGHGHFKF